MVIDGDPLNVLSFCLDPININSVLDQEPLDLLRVSLFATVHGEAQARAELLKNKLYGSTLNSN